MYDHGFAVPFVLPRTDTLVLGTILVWPSESKLLVIIVGFFAGFSKMAKYVEMRKQKRGVKALGETEISYSNEICLNKFDFITAFPFKLPPQYFHLFPTPYLPSTLSPPTTSIVFRQCLPNCFTGQVDNFPQQIQSCLSSFSSTCLSHQQELQSR